MNDHIHLFATEAEFTSAYTNDYSEPWVSYCMETSGLSYNKATIPPEASDIVYYNGNILKYCKQSDWSSRLGTPVAVVVVPGSHTPDGTVRAMAITSLNIDGSSSSTEVHIKWGPQLADTGLPNLNKVVTWGNTIGSTISASSDSSYLSSNKGFTGSTDVLDSSLKYKNTTGPFIPNPYLPNGSPNPDYRNVIEATSANTCADFDGAGNTAKILENYEYRQEYSAANACYLYSTPGISTGQWYLPSAGELGYVLSRFNQIQSAINTVGGLVLDNFHYWCSREYSTEYAWALNIPRGLIGPQNKSSVLYVRPFCSLPVNLGF